MTPHEALYGEKPCVQHLKIFGCDAYAHVPKGERSKLDVKAQKCILLGYGTVLGILRLRRRGALALSPWTFGLRTFFVLIVLFMIL